MTDLPKYWESMDVGSLWEELNRPERFAEAPAASYSAVVWSLIHGRGKVSQHRHRLARFSDRQILDLITALRKHNCDPAVIAEIESGL